MDDDDDFHLTVCYLLHLIAAAVAAAFLGRRAAAGATLAACCAPTSMYDWMTLFLFFVSFRFRFVYLCFCDCFDTHCFTLRDFSLYSNRMPRLLPPPPRVRFRKKIFFCCCCCWIATVGDECLCDFFFPLSPLSSVRLMVVWPVYMRRNILCTTGGCEEGVRGCCMFTCTGEREYIQICRD